MEFLLQLDYIDVLSLIVILLFKVIIGLLGRIKLRRETHLSLLAIPARFVEVSWSSWAWLKPAG